MKNIEKYQKLIAKGEVDALLLTSKHNLHRRGRRRHLQDAELLFHRLPLY